MSGLDGYIEFLAERRKLIKAIAKTYEALEETKQETKPHQEAVQSLRDSLQDNRDQEVPSLATHRDLTALLNDAQRLHSVVLQKRVDLQKELADLKQKKQGFDSQIQAVKQNFRGFGKVLPFERE